MYLNLAHKLSARANKNHGVRLRLPPSFDTSGFYLGLKIDEFSWKYWAYKTSAKSFSLIIPKTRSFTASAIKSLSLVNSYSFNDKYSSATINPVLLLASGKACAIAILAAYLAAISKISSKPS